MNDPTPSPAPVAPWTYALGRLPEHMATAGCQHKNAEGVSDCRIDSAPYRVVASRRDDHREGRLCAKHAAALAHTHGLAFPPGLWKGDTIGRAPQVFHVEPGTPMATCGSCRENIRWTVTDGGKRMPVNLDGSSHFSTCPNANAHRKTR